MKRILAHPAAEAVVGETARITKAMAARTIICAAFEFSATHLPSLQQSGSTDHQRISELEQVTSE